MSDNENKIIQELETLAATEGFEEGTDPFEKRLRQLKVIKCREMRGEHTCSTCEAFDHCEIAKQVLRDHRGF